MSTGITALILCCMATASGSQSVIKGRFIKEPRTVLLSNISSSEVVNVTGVLSRLECLAECQLKGCLLASLIPSLRLCQLVLVNDASQGLGPAGTHVQRLVGSEAGAKVWKAENFEALLKARQLDRITFKSSGTGKTGSIQSVTIPWTGCYRIEVSGAKGGTNSFSGKAGGGGAFVSGTFNLTAGTQLTIVVGQAGGPQNSMYRGGGGGGSSFVYKTVNESLLAAAGGGGAGTYSSAGLPGEAGINGSDPFSNQNPSSYGGANGQPGFNDPSAMTRKRNLGGCGAGWLGKPVNPRRGPDDGEGGGSRAEGWTGGAAGGSNTGDGGFGGGGGGGTTNPNWGAAGAGGGFSGGGTGYSGSPPGGGGGSFCSGSGCSATTGGNSGQHGQVVIRLVFPFAESCE